MIKRGFRRNMIAGTVITVFLLVGAFSVRSYNMNRFHVEKQTRFMMDTFVSMYVIGPPNLGAEAMKAAFERMQEVSDKFNNRDPKGPIYAFNHHGTPIADPEILHVAQNALEISRKTDGAFDITVEPLVELWGFYGDHPALPDDAAIQACLQHIGYQHLKIDNGVMTKDDPAVRVDMGGIAKGYCIGQAAAVLREKGIASALIDAGGDVYALGRRGTELWKVGIRSPRGNDILGFMEVENLAVMGSGDYERFFEHEGKRYHHIFDPRTGYPANGIQGATLLHADPMLADAWNTAVFVLGEKKGRAMVENFPGMEVAMITDTAEVRVTTGLANALRMNSETNLSIARRQ